MVLQCHISHLSDRMNERERKREVYVSYMRQLMQHCGMCMQDTTSAYLCSLREREGREIDRCKMEKTIHKYHSPTTVVRELEEVEESSSEDV